MKALSIDIETYSSVDLTKAGTYRYAEAEDFEILLFGYAFDDEPVRVIDLRHEEALPQEVLNALADPSVRKVAHNANFERVCISRHFYEACLPAAQWECTMAKAAQLSLPLSLEAVAKALKLEVQKDAAGKALIKYFSVPCKPTKKNGGRTRNLPEHDPEKWEMFKEYCRRDVEVERAIRAKLAFFHPIDRERRIWILDQQINDKGVMVDPVLVNSAIRIDAQHKQVLTEEAVKITGLGNPNSVSQLKEWLYEETGGALQVSSLSKTEIPEIIRQVSCQTIQRVLTLRQEMSKTSVKKYASILNYLCTDGRVRGLLQYYGANRTGRWAGRGIQVHNLPRNTMQDLDLARSLVRDGNIDTLELLFDSIPDTLSQLVRTAFVAAPGHRFIAADFSAIEARVIAWIAREQWRLDVFNTHGKIYEASAAQMFKVPLESITKGSELRQKGKISELALGYQGSANALIAMGALREGLKEEELPELVAAWRRANPGIVKLWSVVEAAAIEAVATRRPIQIMCNIRFIIEKGILFIELPSGRRLAYLRPVLRANKFGGESLYYEGVDQTKKKWGLQQTYGGKLVENIVQAVARDVLAEAMLRLDKAGYSIVMHVHDEVVLEVPEGKGSTEEVNRIMGEPIPWAKGLPLKAESYETSYYKKD